MQYLLFWFCILLRSEDRLKESHSIAQSSSIFNLNLLNKLELTKISFKTSLYHWWEWVFTTLQIRYTLIAIINFSEFYFIVT
jgi:hypothetical protein